MSGGPMVIACGRGSSPASADKGNSRPVIALVHGERKW